eukprot:g24322.t1
MSKRGVDAPKLRNLIKDCIAKHLYPSAAFFADKLCTVSKDRDEDVLLLARTYYHAKQYRRATHLLRRKGFLAPTAPRTARYLGALCLAESSEWEECLAVLGEEEEIDFKRRAAYEQAAPAQTRLDFAAQTPAGANWLELQTPFSSSSSSTSPSSLSVPHHSSSLFPPVTPAVRGAGTAPGSHSFNNKTPFDSSSLPTPASSYPTHSGSSSAALPFSPFGPPVGASRVGRSGAGPASAQPALQGSSAESPLLDQDATLPEADGISLKAAMHFLAGRAHEAMENRALAAVSYKNAVYADVRCVQAFERLLEQRMISHSQEQEFLKELSFPEDLEWLRLIYAAKLDEHDFSGESGMQDKCNELEEKYDLRDNLEVQAGLATSLYTRNLFPEAYRLSKSIIQQDPYQQTVLPVYICSLVELKMKSQLFFMAHQLVDAYAQQPIAWFAVGCYYYLIRKYDVARRYFSKATNLERYFVAAWIGFANAFAAQDESDQAMAAYRTAARLFEGYHIPLLYIGMQHLRTHSLQLAETTLSKTRELCPTDPLVYNELGVVAYRQRRWEQAVDHFQAALKLVPNDVVVRRQWEPTLFNLGHCFRKLHRYDKAIAQYKEALVLVPKEASLYAAIGFTLHLKGQLDKCIEYYHKALSLNPQDSFTSDMLSRALEEMY